MIRERLEALEQITVHLKDIGEQASKPGVDLPA